MDTTDDSHQMHQATTPGITVIFLYNYLKDIYIYLYVTPIPNRSFKVLEEWHLDYINIHHLKQYSINFNNHKSHNINSYIVTRSIYNFVNTMYQLWHQELWCHRSCTKTYKQKILTLQWYCSLNFPFTSTLYAQFSAASFLDITSDIYNKKQPLPYPWWRTISPKRVGGGGSYIYFSTHLFSVHFFIYIYALKPH